MKSVTPLSWNLNETLKNTTIWNHKNPKVQQIQDYVKKIIRLFSIPNVCLMLQHLP